ncbi:MAG: type II toxin-antitoxin system mRNA interferase toxin, RelE/StbE family [Desulfovermiculus sp.]|nr:type II toxin-antitoxin system mRNA interferase toxin, RelE/StbE family [Desulfovermiculus sp.]
MYQLAWSQSFKRAFKKAAKNNSDLQIKIFSVLDKLCQDPFDPKLKSHKLRGRLSGLWACYVEYDCRIVFAFHEMPDQDSDLIVLIDIGKHDEVY